MTDSRDEIIDGGGPSLDEEQPAAFPLEESPSAPLPTETDGGTTRALWSLLSITPFIDLHERAGGEHRIRGFLSFWLDLILRLAVWLIMVGIIVTVAWKVLAPLPPLFEK